jgi:hypothetical protein
VACQAISPAVAAPNARFNTRAATAAAFTGSKPKSGVNRSGYNGG